MNCNEPGCNQPARGRGKCNMHYMRLYRSGAVAAVREEPIGVPMLREERFPRIRSDAAPPRGGRISDLEKTVRQMQRGQWVSVPEVKARSMQRIVRRLGGNSTWYRTSDLLCCFKVLDAPWANENYLRTA